jgi:hypothetical protein
LRPPVDDSNLVRRDIEPGGGTSKAVVTLREATGTVIDRLA